MELIAKDVDAYHALPLAYSALPTRVVTFHPFQMIVC
jgi:hypothetical protein